MASWLEMVATCARLKREVFATVEAAVWRERPDVRARDVIVLTGWLSRPDDEELDQRGPRLLEVLVDGLRTRKT